MLSKSSIDLCLCVGARCASLLLHVCVCVCCLFVRINVADCYPAWRQQPRLRFVVWSHDAGRLNVFGGWVHRSIRLYSRDKRDSYAWWRWRIHTVMGAEHTNSLCSRWKRCTSTWYSNEPLRCEINICWHLRSVFPVAWLPATAEKVKNSWLCRGQTKTLNMVRPCDTRIDSLECYNLQSSYAFSKKYSNNLNKHDRVQRLCVSSCICQRPLSAHRIRFDNNSLWDTKATLLLPMLKTGCGRAKVWTQLNQWNHWSLQSSLGRDLICTWAI